MLIDRIEWVGDRVHVHLFELDGRHETMVLYPSEALGLLKWLVQEQAKLLRMNEQRIEALLRKEKNV